MRPQRALKGRRFAALLLVMPGATFARDLPLAQPMDCVLGVSCYIQNYVDHDPGPGTADFACGSLSYDTHKGTDFALPSLAAMADGVNVLAAAPGTVRAVRDGEPDIAQTGPDAPDVTGRECGNGVVISHGDGWQTQYCHMAEGSISVAVGDRVVIGTVLGQVGLSGQTQFPHLHLVVRKNGTVVDPFAPDSLTTCGEASQTPLWSPALPAPAGGIVSTGFATSVPSYDAVLAGDAAAPGISTNDQALVFWALAYGARDGDTLSLTIRGPDGQIVFEKDEVLNSTLARFFRAGGRRTPEGGWPAGSYTGTAILIRDDLVIGTQRADITVN